MCYVAVNILGVFCAAHFQHSRSNQLVRKELQQHLYQHQHLIQAYTDHLQRHTHQMLALVLNTPSAASPTNQPQQQQQQSTVTAAEFDRLALLLKVPTLEAASDDDGGSPMQISPTPFTGAAADPESC